MADGINFDFSDIVKLAADLGTVPENAGDDIRKAVEVTARHVKDDWREPLQGSQHIPGGAASVTYSMGSEGESLVREVLNSGSFDLANTVVAEIGPELKGQGAIVGMLEYGTPTTGARGFGAAALEKNQADFEKGLEKALRDAEGKAGLL
jgi:predicted secreted protein